METFFKVISPALILLTTTIASAQNHNKSPSEGTLVPYQFENVVCISDADRTTLLEEVEANKQMILQTNPEVFDMPFAQPEFILPFRAKEGFDDFGYYIVVNQVDHNSSYGQILDYNCGERTYDVSGYNHQGTDFSLWPYSWLRMDEGVMEVLAAAPGVIVTKKDGNFDRNCNMTGASNWNGFVLEHADGSRTMYLHFKSGSLISKEVGDTVEQGEFLGLSGSSGSSTGPHLHFEVFNSSNQLMDPYAGPCNEKNSDSWWEEQPNYLVREVLSLSTHYSTEYDYDCPEPENPFYQFNFEDGEEPIFKIFFRDLTFGDQVHFIIERPDGSHLYNWTWNNTYEDYTGAYLAYTLAVVNNTWQTGIHTIKATFGGKEYEAEFGIRTPLGVDDFNALNVLVYPNPTKNSLNIEADFPIEKVTIYDMNGRKISENKPTSVNANIDVRHLNKGVYMAEIIINGKRSVKKFVKE